jgi:raffinose/stachyose/melibiose transport system permease protein
MSGAGPFRYTRRTLAREVALIAAALVFCLPFYLALSIALETTTQSNRTPLSFPWPPHPGSFTTAWQTGGQNGLSHALLASLIITLSSVAGLIVLGSLCAYTLARRWGRLAAGVYILFVVGIILPFQLAIIPLFVGMKHLGLVGNYLGMIVLNIGLMMPLTVFLYTGFIRALPRDYEEAARVDGAGTLYAFRRVVIPLLWPITVTVAVLMAIAIWNEFFIALVFLTGSRAQTVPVALYTFVEGQVTHWNLIFAGVLITIAPILGFYLFAQRHLIRGFSAGVKG